MLALFFVLDQNQWKDLHFYLNLILQYSSRLCKRNRFLKLIHDPVNSSWANNYRYTSDGLEHVTGSLSAEWLSLKDECLNFCKSYTYICSWIRQIRTEEAIATLKLELMAQDWGAMYNEADYIDYALTTFTLLHDKYCPIKEYNKTLP